MEKTEYKVGEEFQVGFKTLKCVEGEGCGGCFLRERFLDCCILEEFIGPCISYSREDGKDVIFVEVKGDETQYQVEGAYNRRGRTKLDLQLVVPEYLTWKDGDYLTIHYDGYPHTYIFIYKSFKANVSNPIKYHALFNVENNCLKIESETILEGDILPSTPQR